MRGNWQAVVCLGLVGCLTGQSYPERYSRTFCSSLFTCLSPENAEFWSGADSEQECVDNSAGAIESSELLDAWQEGDCEFDADAARLCLAEVDELRDDPDCDGAMNPLLFGLDQLDSSCFEVYDCD